MDGVGDNRGSDGMVGVANNRGNSVVGRVDTVVGLGLSLTLSVVATVVATKSVSVRPHSVSSVSQSISSISVEVRISVSLCFGFRLGSHEGGQGENYELEKRIFSERKYIRICKYCSTSAYHLHVGAGR